MRQERDLLNVDLMKEKLLYEDSGQAGLELEFDKERKTEICMTGETL